MADDSWQPDTMLSVKCSVCKVQVTVEAMIEHFCSGQGRLQSFLSSKDVHDISYAVPSISTAVSDRICLRTGKQIPTRTLYGNGNAIPKTPNAQSGFRRPENCLQPQITATYHATPSQSSYDKKPGNLVSLSTHSRSLVPSCSFSQSLFSQKEYSEVLSQSKLDGYGGPLADLGLRILGESNKHAIKANPCGSRSGGHYRSASIYSGINQMTTSRGQSDASSWGKLMNDVQRKIDNLRPKEHPPELLQLGFVIQDRCTQVQPRQRSSSQSLRTRETERRDDYPILPSQNFTSPAERQLSSGSRFPAIQSTQRCCRSCRNEIMGKSITSADGRLSGRYHKACFVCDICRAPFQTTEFYVYDDKPYCKQHYHERNGSICSSCGDGIEGQYFEDEHTNKYHIDCF